MYWVYATYRIANHNSQKLNKWNISAFQFVNMLQFAVSHEHDNDYSLHQANAALCVT